MSDVQPFEIQEDAVAPQETIPRQETFTSHETIPHRPLEPPDLTGRSFGWILLNHRESIFEMIAAGENLDGMIRYFSLFIGLF